MRSTSRPGRAGLAALLAVTVTLLVGCANVPISGPVEHHSAANGIGPGVHVDPLPPAPGASQLLVVEGFLHAMGAYQPDYAVARQYLTADASKSWHPESGIQVYADGFPPTEAEQTVVLVAPLTGTVDATGGFRVASGQLRHDFVLVKDSAGQWRISRPPDGLLVSRYLFSTSFTAANLHFLDLPGSALVPDPRFFAAGEQAVAVAVNAQLAGPAEWLAPAVRSLDTAAVRLEGVAINADSSVDIQLNTAAAAVPADQRQALLAELVYTVTGIGQISTVRVSVGGQPWRSQSGQVDLSRDSFSRLAPSANASARSLAVVRDHKLQRVADPTNWSELTPVGVPLQRPEQFAVRSDLGEVAAVTAEGTKLEVAEPGASKAREVRTGKGLLRPDFARDGELWSPAAGKVDQLRVYRGDSSVKVDAAALPNLPVVAAAVSPDGARVALLLRREGRTEVGLALVSRSENRIVLSGWRPVDVATSTGNTGKARDVGWVSETELVLLMAGGENGDTVIRISQDGATATDLGPSDGRTLLQLAVVPVQPIVVLASGGGLYRFDGAFNWTLSLMNVEAVAYSG